jgi:hypothetical protein
MMMMGGGRWGTIPTEDSRKQDGILYFTVVKVDAAVDASTDEGIVMETLQQGWMTCCKRRARYCSLFGSGGGCILLTAIE